MQQPALNSTAFGPSLPPDVLNNYAWIGDAVLLLYARKHVMRESGKLDNAACVRMTSNQFLGALGEPTRVEAEIGRVYLEAGYGEAERWIETWLMPIFNKQESKRERLKHRPIKGSAASK